MCVGVLGWGVQLHVPALCQAACAGKQRQLGGTGGQVLCRCCNKYCVSMLTQNMKQMQNGA